MAFLEVALLDFYFTLGLDEHLVLCLDVGLRLEATLHLLIEGHALFFGALA